MTILETNPQARRCATRIRKESELAKLEYQCDVLRGAWLAAMAALAKRSAHANPTLAREVRKWAGVVGRLEERIERAALDLDAFLRGDS